MPPLPGTRKPGWVPESLGVKAGENGRLVEILEGRRNGPLFVAKHTSLTGSHRKADVDYTGWYVLAVVSTGHQILSVAAETDVLQAAGILLADRACREGLARAGRQEIINALPGWVRPWAKACCETGRCVDPGPYQTF